MKQLSINNNFIQILIFGFFVIISITGCNPTKHLVDEQYLLDNYDVKFNGDHKGILKSDIETYIKQKPNHKIFSMRLHLMVYNLVDPEREEQRKALRKLKEKGKIERGKKIKEKKYLTEWLMEIGEAPVIYDIYKTKKTSQQINLFLSSKGFFENTVTDTTTFHRKHKLAKVEYRINLGQPYTISNINYNVEDQNLQEIVYNDLDKSLLKNGMRYDEDVIEKERVRIEAMLKNTGFYNFTKENIKFSADSTLTRRQIALTMNIRERLVMVDSVLTQQPNTKYKIDKIDVFTDFDPKRALVEKSTYLSTFSINQSTNKFSFYNSPDFRIKPSAIFRETFIYADSIYNQDNVKKTYLNLSSLNIFKSANIIFNDSPKPFRTDTNYLDCQIRLTPYTRQGYDLLLEGSNASGNFGIAGNFIYKHRNLFKGAENFNLNLRAAREAQMGIIDDTLSVKNKVLNTKEYGFGIDLMFPRNIFTSKSTTSTSIYKVRSQFSTSYNFQQRPDYTRSIANGEFKYLWNKRDIQKARHYFTPLQINYVEVKNQTDTFLTWIERLPIKHAYEDQLITAINYSIIFDNQKFANSKDYFYLRIFAEEAGNIINLAYKLSNQNKVDDRYQLIDLPFSQYIKFEADFRYYHDLNNKDKIAIRQFVGIAYPYGNSKSGLPFIKQYYSGGANSIRAWKVRDLGPGSYRDTTVYPNQTSDMKLEVNIEYRYKMFWIIEGALFFDAGNIWSLNKEENRPGTKFKLDSFYRQIAFGAGVGLRFDFSFFIFRTDFGLKLRDPAEPSGKRWVLLQPDYKPTLWNLTMGISYPF